MSSRVRIEQRVRVRAVTRDRGPSLDLQARQVVMASYLYYRQSVSIMSDHEFDAMCQRLADHWDELDEFRQWQLGSKREIRASGFHTKVTVIAESAACRWAQAKRLELDPDRVISDDEWRYSKQRHVHWVSADA